jgi:hypothetical protein
MLVKTIVSPTKIRTLIFVNTEPILSFIYRHLIQSVSVLNNLHLVGHLVIARWSVSTLNNLHVAGDETKGRGIQTSPAVGARCVR